MTNPPFVWDFQNLRFEIEAIDPQDPVADFDIISIVKCVDHARKIQRISPGEAYQLFVMLHGLPG